MTELSDDLIHAYQMTNYQVRSSDGDFTLHVGKSSEALTALFEKRGVKTAAFLTAWNPQSRPTSEVENDAAHQALVSRAEAIGAAVLNGSGSDATGQWPPEQSLLILGVDRGVAEMLARDFDQNAFIWCDQDAVPQLILMR